MKPSLVITGGSGFLGQYLARQLTNEFLIWVADVRKPTGLTAKFAECDLLRYQAVLDLFQRTKPDTIIHLAAITGIERCREKPSESFLLNVVGTFNVAWMSTAFGARLIFASSKEVYGETTEAESDENADLRPNNLYGLTKLMGESVIRWLEASMGLRCVILRFTNLYGAGGDQYAVAAFIKKAIRGEEITVLGGDQTLNLIDVRDAARAVKICLAKEQLHGEVFNIGSKETVKVNDLVSRILRLTGSKSRIVRTSKRAGDTMFFNPGLSKARRELGFEPSLDLDHGLKDCIEYYQAQAKQE